MQYPVPAELTLDGRGIDWNTDLSALDRQHIAARCIRAWPDHAAHAADSPADQEAVPSDLPEIVLGGPAAKLPIPAPGKPARFA
jgi:hypothetical protein